MLNRAWNFAIGRGVGLDSIFALPAKISFANSELLRDPPPESFSKLVSELNYAARFLISFVNFYRLDFIVIIMFI